MAVLIACSVLLAPMAALADSVTFKVRSFSRVPVEVAFHSQNRKHVWPQPGTSYLVSDYEVKSFNLSCVKGERICYGATIKGRASSYWGVSSAGGKACQGCCYTCGGTPTTPIINLNER